MCVMVQRVVLSIVMLAACGLWFASTPSGEAALQEGAAPGSDAARAFQPVASIDSLMNGQKEQHDALRALLADRKASGRSKKIHRAAELLAEFANVNTFHKDKPDYRAWAREVRDGCVELAVEANKRGVLDENRMQALFTRITATCESCHDVYQ
jgi:hypothetical protein